MKCHFDRCHDIDKNKKYCQECNCYRKVDAARRRAPAKTVSCAFDECHRFLSGQPGRKYCVECKCYEKARRSRSRITIEDEQKLFEKPQEYAVLRISALADGTKVLIVNDLHIPFEDRQTLEPITKFWDDFSPDIEIYNGDIADCYELSAFDRNPSRALSLQDELDAVRVFLDGRSTANPDCRRIFGDGNHEDRLRRWLWRHGPELHSLRALQLEELLGLGDFEHVNYRSVVDILGFRVEHGYRASKSAARPMNVAQLMAHATNSSGLCGHTHRMNVVHWTSARGSHSYRENGSLCRQDLEYAPFPNWQTGFSYGIVYRNKLHVTTVPVYDTGFRCEGEFYPRL